LRNHPQINRPEIGVGWLLAEKEAEMLRRAIALLGLSLLVSFGFAKDKTKNVLPAYVLSAHTVAIIVDPQASISIDDPQANQMAQKDVEAALLRWGRFEPVPTTQGADLINVVRKGNGHLTDETMHGAPQNTRPGGINSPGGGGPAGPQHGVPQGISETPGLGQSDEAPRPQLGIGDTADSFTVFQGGKEKPLESAPAWKYMANDGLLPHSVPAVAAFKKAIADAEKAEAKKQEK
jgi:hypothetical protein